MAWRPQAIAGVVALSLVLAGCEVGPNYARPGMASPNQFRFQAGAENASIADLPWWTIYDDPVLQDLIKTALENNYDLRIAVSRIEQAQAIAAQARSQYFPTVGYQGNVSRGKNEFLGSFNPDSGATNSAALIGIDAAWEVDLWGRIRRLNEAALAQLLSTVEAERGVVLSLVSAVARAYFELLALDEFRKIAIDTTQSYTETLRIFDLRLTGGTASKLETSRAEALRSSAAAVVPETELQIGQKENEINVLCGRDPGPVARGSTLYVQRTPPEVPAGLPSQLLERRPDLLVAEAQIKAANANVGVATANFFPTLTLSGLLGRVSPELSAFSGGGANAWSIAAGLTGPIFEGGRLTAQLQQAKAVWEETKLQYERTALNALREVSDALIAHEKLVGVFDDQRDAVKSYRTAVDVAQLRYINGKSSYYEVLEVQQSLFPAELSLAQTRLNQLVAIVDLYKSLGGGWNLVDAAAMPEPMTSPTSPTSPEGATGAPGQPDASQAAPTPVPPWQRSLE